MKIIVLLVLLSSCSISSLYLQSDATKYSATKAEEIKIYSTVKITKRYKVIGSLFVDIPSQEGVDVLAALKEKAASFGADAVIRVRFTKFSSFGRGGANGVAIKFY